MRFQNVDKRRIFALNKNENIRGPVLYWMTREQRADDNWGLLLAQEVAKNTKTPLHVCFCLKEDIPERMSFQIAGLEETAARLQELNIPLHFLKGDDPAVIKQLVDDVSIGLMITDFLPLKEAVAMQSQLNGMLNIPFWEVDSHNIVPARQVSSVRESSVKTFEDKIYPVLDEYLVDYLPLVKHPYNDFEFDNSKGFQEVVGGIKAGENRPDALQIKPGTNEALNTLVIFLEQKLAEYANPSSDPDAAILNNLSSYLHFGQISAQRVALAVNKMGNDPEARRRFMENLVVRKELCDNFCLYQENYDSFEGADEWARESLLKHKNDKREYLYSLQELEQGSTHSGLWNAAHNQLCKTGLLHWLLRKFWGSMILQWSPSPEEAVARAIMLTDAYSLDAPDPLGYGGVMQSLAGLYQEPVQEQKVSGRIPVVTEKEIEEFLDIKDYISRWGNSPE